MRILSAVLPEDLFVSPPLKKEFTISPAEYVMTQPFEITFILFADMLGFADLVEREGDEINELNPIFTGVELYSPSPA